MEEKILDQRETAAFLKVAENTLEAWRWLGKGPPYSKLGGRKNGAVRYRMSDLLQFLRDTQVRPSRGWNIEPPQSTAALMTKP
jgi:hypothetical protein